MNIKWNEVTWYSKLLAAIFILGVFPALTFYIGVKYHEAIQVQSISLDAFVPTNNDVAVESGRDLNYSCPWSETYTISKEGELYRNTVRGFSITFSQGWYLPKVDEEDPHFYVCASTGQMIDGLEIVGGNILGSEELKKLASKYKPVLLPAVNGTFAIPIADAVIYDVTPQGGQEGDGWPYVYTIVFPSSGKSFAFLSENKIEANQYYFLDSLKPL